MSGGKLLADLFRLDAAGADLDPNTFAGIKTGMHGLQVGQETPTVVVLGMGNGVSAHRAFATDLAYAGHWAPLSYPHGTLADAVRLSESGLVSHGAEAAQPNEAPTACQGIQFRSRVKPELLAQEIRSRDEPWRQLARPGCAPDPARAADWRAPQAVWPANGDRTRRAAAARH